MDKKELESLCRRLPRQAAALLQALSPEERARLEEIRVYDKQGAVLVVDGEQRAFPVQLEMDEWLSALSAQALYGCERQMAMGYIPLPGGHRAGVCGSMVCAPDGSWRMAQVIKAEMVS